MQIQRIQTLMLLIAAIVIGVFCLVPIATIPMAEAAGQSVFVKDAPALLVLNLVIAALLLIVIFMYRNLRQQIKMTILTIVLLCASLVTSAFVIFGRTDGAVPALFGGLTLLVIALIFALLAYRGMKHDHKLLRSADRLR